jgi:hypothetical protein
MLLIVDRSLPGENILDVLHRLIAIGALDTQYLREHPGLDHGLDAWGNEILMIINKDTVVFRSCGRNGKDEGGSGDDLQATVPRKPGKAPKTSGR